MRAPKKARRRRAAYRRNPLWVDEVMSRHWDAIQREVGADLMPLSDRHPMVRAAPEKWPPRKMQEYGCGQYGCVLPVAPGRVMKITTDASEAAFVVSAMTLGDWPPGITPYDGALALPEEYEGLPVYLLWREEAYNVGIVGKDSSSRREYYDKEFGYRQVEIFVNWLLDFRQGADAVFDRFRYGASLEPRPNKDLLHLAAEVSRIRAVLGGGHPSELPREAFGTSEIEVTAAEIVFGLAALESISEEIAGMPFGSSVGFALGFYARRGLLLADVHTGNVGEIRDTDDPDDWDLAIIDPGVMTPLDPRWLRVDVPSI